MLFKNASPIIKIAFETTAAARAAGVSAVAGVCAVCVWRLLDSVLFLEQISLKKKRRG